MEELRIKEKVISIEDYSLKHGGFIYRLIYPCVVFKSLYKVSDTKNKKALRRAFFFPGLGDLVLRKVENFIFGLLLVTLFLLYFVSVGYRQLFGIDRLSFFPLWLIPVILILLLLLYWYKTFSQTVKHVYNLNEGKVLEVGILTKTYHTLQKKYQYGIKITSYTYRNGKGDAKFRLLSAYLLPFIPFFLRKQFIKAFSILISYMAYFTYMGLIGFSSVKHLIYLSNYIGDRRQPLVYGIIAVIFTLYTLFVYISSQVANTKAENALLNGRKVLTFKQEIEELKHNAAYKIMLFIPIFGALLFTIIPLVFMITLAFTNFNLAKEVGINDFIWTGLQSFKNLFDGGTNLKAFFNVFSWTMLWAFFATFTCYFGGFFLALLIAKKTVKWKKLYRSLFVVAMAIPQFVSLRVMYALFHDFGPINQLLMNMGAKQILFWSDVRLAKTLIILINMWVGIPYFMLLISGLLINIPKEYYEAAEVDGASKWYTFKKITFPYIIFATTPLLITSFVSNINNFNVIWLLTRGGPLGQGTGGVAGGTDIFITWLYKLTMYNLNVAEYDIGAAIGIIMFIISSVISLIIFRNTGAYKKESEFRK